MTRPLVSTITPCYRMGKYLGTFLDSLPRQTYFDRLEVVLDHNEPDDREIDLVRRFQHAHPGRLKHIVVEKVDPIGVSMNRCMREASGELLAIWNVDDLRTPDSIEAQVDALTRDPDADIVYGDYISVTSFGATEGLAVRHRPVPPSEFTRSMIFGPFFLFRRSLLSRAGDFDEQLKSGADFDFSVRLAFHGKAVMADRMLGYYLNAGLGASTRPNSLQPVERTVIELRYGIYDKIDYDYLPAALKYDVTHLVSRGTRVSVEHLVPHYDELLTDRKGELLPRGVLAYCTRRQKARAKDFLRAARRRLLGR